MSDTPKKDIELIGPMLIGGHYNVAIDGYLVPFIKVDGGGREWCVTVRDHLAFDLMLERPALEQVLRVIACAMAVAAGWSCFGENAKPLEPFRTRISGMGTMKDTP